MFLKIYLNYRQRLPVFCCLYETVVRMQKGMLKQAMLLFLIVLKMVVIKKCNCVPLIRQSIRCLL